MRGEFLGLGGWQKNSFVDFPGTVSTVLFYTGCNLRCPYCHNPRLACGETVDGVGAADVRSFLQRRRDRIEGVVLSGGEPTIHPTVVDTAVAVRRMGYRLKLDTNGLLPKIIERIAPDYLALDVKTRPALYPSLLRASVEYGAVVSRLTAAIEQVRRMGAMAEVRITVVPGIVDQVAVEELAELLAGVALVYLQPMHRRHALLDPKFNLVEPYSLEKIERMRQMLAPRVGECRIRSIDR